MTEKKYSKLFANTFFENQNTFYDTTEEELLGLLNNYIYSNDSESAKNLILYINWCYENGSSPNPKILEPFIYHAFKKVVEEGITPDQAFCFKGVRGKYPRPDNYERNLEATIRMILLIRSGETYINACADVAIELCPDDKGERAIKDAYSLYKDYFNQFSSEDLEAMLNK